MATTLPRVDVVEDSGASSVANAFACISLICGIGGLFVYGTPLGIIALVCGILAWAMGANGGKLGLFVGIAALVLATPLLGLLSGLF